MLVEFQTCIHRVCLPCVHTILEEDTQRKKANFMGFPIEIMECPAPDCLKQIPIVCLKAMEMALKGNLIGVIIIKFNLIQTLKFVVLKRKYRRFSFTYC